MPLQPHNSISTFFTYREAVYSESAERNGIDNTPPQDVLKTIYKTASKMDAIRMLLGSPITVTSWYRCLDLNRAIGSKDTSQHLTGAAVDFVCPRYGSPRQIVRRLMDEQVQYDQLILEFESRPSGGWVHISFADAPRLQELVIDANGTSVFV